jgi:hypothetical protein
MTVTFQTNLRMIFLAACAKKRVANLWRGLAAHHVYAMATNGKECEILSESLVAATFEKAKTYALAATAIYNPTVCTAAFPPTWKPCL